MADIVTDLSRATQFINDLNNVLDNHDVTSEPTPVEDLPDLIDSALSGQSGDLDELVATENGNYTPGAGYIGFNSVHVNVQPSLENKYVHENGTYTPGQGYDGINQVVVDVSPNLQYKSITRNGEYTPDEGYDGFSTVEVNVPQVQPNLETVNKTVTSNGSEVITPSQGYDGIGSVNLTVDVPSGSTNLQFKNVSVSSNGEEVVTPDSGYDGLSQVVIDTNVQPDLEVKEVTITENGIHSYSSSDHDGISRMDITVNVPATHDTISFEDYNRNNHNSFSLHTSKFKTNGAKVNLASAFRSCGDVDFGIDHSTNKQDILCSNLNSAFFGCGYWGTQVASLDLSRLKIDNTAFGSDTTLFRQAFSRINTKKLILDMDITDAYVLLTFGDENDVNNCPIEEIVGLRINQNTANSRTLNDAFKYCNKLVSIKNSEDSVGSWVVTGGINRAFMDCSALTTLPDIKWYRFNGNMENMFRNCAALTSVYCLAYDNVESSYSADSAFKGCTNLESVVLNLDYVNNVSNMFDGCTSLTHLKLHEEEQVGRFIHSFNWHSFGAYSSASDLTLDLSASDVLRLDELANDIANIEAPDITGKTRTIKVSSAVYNTYTSAVSSIEAKGYTVTHA